jgi:altronate dehydratase
VNLRHTIAELKAGGRAKETGEDIRVTNPIPENIAGGLSTLKEKSLKPS